MQPDVSVIIGRWQILQKGHLTLLRAALGNDRHEDQLAVRRGASGGPAATLTAAGHAGLVYGVLEPLEAAIRGYGEVPAEAATELRALFPRRAPRLFADF